MATFATNIDKKLTIPPRFFANPHEESYIEAIPGTFSTEVEKKYKGTKSGEYYRERLTNTY